MLKKKSKIAILLVILLLVLSSISFATDTPVTTSMDNVNTISDVPGDNARDEGNPTPSTHEDIYNGDLYLFDNDIVMEQLVDGNVYLFGNNIKVSGKVNGSLYAFGNNVTFEKDSYIVQSIYVFGNTVTINGSANDIYAFARQVNMSYDSFAIRDLRVNASIFNFNGGVGRNAFVNTDTFNFINDNQKSAIIYGDLKYSSSKELELPEDLVQGEITFKQSFNLDERTISNIVLDYIIDFCNGLLYALVIFFLCLWLAPKFLQKTSNYINVKEGFTSFGIGVLASFVAIFISFALLFTIVGLPLAFSIFGLFALMLSITMAICSICITYKLKEVFNYTKNYYTYLTLVGVVIVLWALKQIPYIGWIISLIITFFGFGVILHYLFTRNKNIDTTKKEKSSK